MPYCTTYDFFLSTVLIFIFTLRHVTHHNSNICVAGFAGTPGYLSPEVLKKEPYGKPVDIWACGE